MCTRGCQAAYELVCNCATTITSGARAQVRATSLQELVYKQGQAGITKAAVSITFRVDDPSRAPTGYEDKETITITRQVRSSGTLQGWVDRLVQGQQPVCCCTQPKHLTWECAAAPHHAGRYRRAEQVHNQRHHSAGEVRAAWRAFIMPTPCNRKGRVCTHWRDLLGPSRTGGPLALHPADRWCPQSMKGCSVHNSDITSWPPEAGCQHVSLPLCHLLQPRG